MSGANNSPLGDTSRFLERQIGAWLFTLSFPAYCALIRLLLSRCGYSTVRALDPGSSPSASGRRYSGEGGLDLLAFAHTDMATFLSAVGVKTGRILWILRTQVVEVHRRRLESRPGASPWGGASWTSCAER